MQSAVAKGRFDRANARVEISDRQTKSPHANAPEGLKK
ncbi:Hypothetical protein Bdt_3602 [Bdellovibrio bacteriovorus str. Tiberius]|uniref:Uncharacterized protein n=1 Tax=Bdellovibrio bacteriovorus str. Tiberius TaxID=1069642 RepID=K7ZHA3_BDEBC|nr:Hypothetical protein Bdt_3602 [Bdellovibrio bacteriovorus str. Tiberius]